MANSWSETSHVANMIVAQNTGVGATRMRITSFRPPCLIAPVIALSLGRSAMTDVADLRQQLFASRNRRQEPSTVGG